MTPTTPRKSYRCTNRSCVWAGQRPQSTSTKACDKCGQPVELAPGNGKRGGRRSGGRTELIQVRVMPGTRKILQDRFGTLANALEDLATRAESATIPQDAQDAPRRRHHGKPKLVSDLAKPRYFFELVAAMRDRMQMSDADMAEAIGWLEEPVKDYVERLIHDDDAWRLTVALWCMPGAGDNLALWAGLAMRQRLEDLARSKESA